jgi:hypothetical protein
MEWKNFVDPNYFDVLNGLDDVVDINPNQEDSSTIVEKPNQKAKRKRRPKKELETIENDSHDVIYNENDVQKPKKETENQARKIRCIKCKSNEWCNPQV